MTGTALLRSSPAGGDLTWEQFRRFSRLAYDTFGLSLDDSKKAMVNSRLSKKVRELGVDSFEEYYEMVASDGSGLETLVDALTTNFTGFLRESEHFEILKQMVRQQRSSADLTVWSAACSSGEEPYSILFTLNDEGVGSSVHLLASDISSRVLDRARNGMYESRALDGVPPHWTSGYFVRGGRQWSGWWRVKETYRNGIDFRLFNLLDSPLPSTRFSAIFCRNVMIYFDKPTQKRVVSRLVSCLVPGGYLFIGHAENIGGMCEELRQAGPAVYRLAGGEG